VIMTREHLHHLDTVLSYLHRGPKRFGLDSPVYIDMWGCHIPDELDADIHLGVALTTQGHAALGELVDPLELCTLTLRGAVEVELGYRTHLGVQESVPKKKLLTLEVTVFIRDLSPFRGVIRRLAPIPRLGGHFLEQTSFVR
jgi:hypothetical protein